ncbi:MAG: pilus assembly PilX N-terminal domain-containing protein [Candidatus Eisenbacteria bacterium]
MLLRNEEGSGLVLAILIIVALFVLGTSLAFLTRTDVNISGHQTQYVEAVYVAEAGVEEAIQRLSLPDSTNVTVNGTSINAAIKDASNPPNPNWKARIFLCRPGQAPAAGTNEYHTVTVQNAANWLAYSTASDLAKALTIEHKWKDRNDDGARADTEIVRYDPGKVPPENFKTGSVVEVISVTGKSATAERQIKSEVTKFPLNVNVKAAVLSDGKANLKGSLTVCGHDHSIGTLQDADIPDCADYTSCHQSGGVPCVDNGCLYAVMTTGDVIDKTNNTKLAGVDAAGGSYPENTDSSNTFYTLAQTLGLTQEEVDNILAQANHHSGNEPGQLDGITYIDHDATGAEKFNNVNGSGLLYVNGDLDVASGGMVWRGLVYVEGDFKITGKTWILGAVVVKGSTETAVNFGAGTPSILYSSEALDYYLRQPLGFVQIGWKETSGL